LVVNGDLPPTSTENVERFSFLRVCGDYRIEEKSIAKNTVRGLKDDEV
jgi:hypothetical protein